MKKSFLFIFACFLFISTHAQYRIVNINGVELRINENDKPAPMIKSNIGESNFPLVVTNNTTSNYSATNKVNTTSIGVTTYDLQTNAAIDDRTYNFTNLVSSIWTFSITNSLAAPDRGTGYNHYNGSSWGAAPNTRVETVRTGWPSIGITANGAEHIIAHEFALFDMKHNTRAAAGTGAWTQTNLPLMNGTIFNDWPRLAIGGSDGNSLHLIDIAAPVGNGGSIVQGMDGPITYSRSEDAGATWNLIHTILPDFDSTLYEAGVGADAYAIDANGTNVAIVAGRITNDWAIWKSTDNGTTFTKTVVNQFPFPNYDDVNNITDVNNDGIADTVLTVDGKVAVLIDNNGMIHSWAGAMLIFDDVIIDPLGLFLSTDGLLYWNESMGPDSSVVIAQAPDRDLNGTLDFAYDYAPRYGNGGQTTQPRAGTDASGNIVVSYVTIMENTSSGNPSPGDFSYRNNFLMGSDDNGSTWKTPYNVGNSDFDECVFASIPRNLNGSCIDVIWQQDGLPGIAVQPPDGDQSLHPFSNNDIMHDCIDVTLLGLLVGIEENNTLLNQILVYPNPASHSINLQFNIEKDLAIKFEIINALGQIVFQQASSNYISGNNQISFDLTNLQSGMYLIKAGSGEYEQNLKFMKN